VLEKEVFEDGYGGSSQSKGQRSDASSNAYVLVYIRESSMDEVFAPIPQVNIPSHLKRSLEEERRRLEEQKKQKEEKHLYLNVEVVTEQSFSRHEGFDLAHFSGSSLPLSSLTSFKVLKAETYAAFKSRVTKHFNYPAGRFRFWIVGFRQNKTIRPFFRLPDTDLSSLESIRNDHAASSSDLRLYLELLVNPLKPERPTGAIFIFLKHFDASKQTLFGAGAVWVPRASKVPDLIRIINAQMRFGASTALSLYEEVKPGMIESLKLDATLNQLQIDDGDVICFQRSLSDQETKNLERNGLCSHVVKFYQILQNRILCTFSSSTDKSEFDLLLSKTDNYDIMATKVGKHLDIDPARLRFTTSGVVNSMHRLNIAIERTTTKTLGEIQSINHFMKRAIKYEILAPTANVSAETENEIKKGISWMGHNNFKKSIHILAMKKSETLEEIRVRLAKRAQMSPGGTGKIRFFLTSPDMKTQRPLAMIGTVGDIPVSAEIYAEEISPAELNLRNGERLIDVFHFSKSFSRIHGVPFKFVLKPGEKTSDTRKRLQEQLTLSDKAFSGYRLAIQVSNFRQPLYLDEDEVLYDSKFVPNNLGLDHVTDEIEMRRSDGS
ncbi:ICP0-binding domain of ubiquitin-specific protease 7-domain-containing protein, partial [Gymnopilus junonius]